MKAIGFNAGQFGDLCMNVVAARMFKEWYPDSTLIFGIHKQYSAIKKIFHYNKYIDGIHIWDGYNNWPTLIDKEYINSENFDKVFNAMPEHTHELWYLKRHQIQELCMMHELPIPHNCQIELEKYFNILRHKGVVAICPFGATRGESKSLTIDKASEIINYLKRIGKTPIQIYIGEEPKLPCNQFSASFFEAIKFCLGCDFVITVDTAMAWIMSGYKHPTLGLYGVSYYTGSITSKNWQPINPNAKYLEAMHVNDIDNNLIYDTIGQL